MHLEYILSNYLSSCRKQFAYYKHLGDQTFAQLDDQQLLWRYHESSNSIAIIVNHLSGNMKSRWTDFLVTDGEKPWRDREREFESVSHTRASILHDWEEGWSCLFSALDDITMDRMGDSVYIRHMEHTIVEAINRQLSHYAYHVGQIIYIGTMLKGSAWKSLSIPRGASASYNAAQADKGDHKEHFTDSFLDNDDVA